jgi:hypothetical protein
MVIFGTISHCTFVFNDPKAMGEHKRTGQVTENQALYGQGRS